MLAGEHLPGTTKAGGDLIADQEDAVFGSDLSERLNVFDRLCPHACRSLHERFDNQCRDFLLMGRQHLAGFRYGSSERLGFRHSLVEAKAMGRSKTKGFGEEGT